MPGFPEPKPLRTHLPNDSVTGIGRSFIEYNDEAIVGDDDDSIALFEQNFALEQSLSKNERSTEEAIEYIQTQVNHLFTTEQILQALHECNGDVLHAVLVLYHS